MKLGWGRGARFKFTMMMVSGFLLLGSVSSTRFVARAGLDHEPHSLRQTSLSARAYLAEQREANTSMANEVVVHLEPGTHFIRSALELRSSDRASASDFLPPIHLRAQKKPWCVFASALLRRQSSLAFAAFAPFRVHRPDMLSA